MVEGVTRLVVDGLLPFVPPGPLGMALGCIALGMLTVPQQHCVTLRSGSLLGLMLCMVCVLQYSTATGHWLLGRTWGTLLFGLPNFALSVYALLLTLLHVPLRSPRSHSREEDCRAGLTRAFALRQACWTVYTQLGPWLLIPQTLLVLTWCALFLGPQSCVACALLRE